jgi:hypothetical protein
MKNLALYKWYLLPQFITLDETWTHIYTPEIMKQWTKSCESTPKKVKTIYKQIRLWGLFYGELFSLITLKMVRQLDVNTTQNYCNA